jgi:ABC-type nitrate/sulfonate/bicarbonate transport system substrate-binding protein
LILQREWTANAEFAGDVWASKIAQQHGLKLDVREGSEIIDPIKLVRANIAQFGVASADRVLRENENGAGLVILAAATYRSPVVFLTHPAAKINSPADFKGHRIGIQSGTNTDLILRALIRTVPLTNKDMEIVESGWGTTNFESGRLDVLGAFDYDEPVQLDLKKVPYNMILPENYGVRFVGTVYFASRSFVQKNPEIVQAFMNCLVDGWSHALSHQTDAINMVAVRFPAIDKSKELLSLARGQAYFAGEDGKLLYASEDRWNAMGRELVSLGVLHQFVFADNVDYRFLDVALNSTTPSQ